MTQATNVSKPSSNILSRLLPLGTNTLNNQIKEILDRLEIINKRLIGDLNNYQRERDVLYSEKTSLQLQLKQEEKKIEGIISELTAIQNDLGEPARWDAGILIASIRKKVTEQLHTIEQLEEENSIQQETISQLQDKCDSQSETISQLQDKCDSQSETIAKLQKENARLRKSASTAKTKKKVAK